MHGVPAGGHYIPQTQTGRKTVKIIITSNGRDLDAAASPVFGRAPIYIFLDTETMDFEATDNPAVGAAGGAGIQAAQFVVARGIDAIITGNVGPNAFDVLRAAGIPIYLFQGGTVRQAAESFREGKLGTTGDATAAEHSGMGRGGGRRRSVTPSLPKQEEDITALKEKVKSLRKQLAEVMNQIDQIEGGA
jgi:predicted Fe-Mo cluster-binding NifX family protein